VPHIVERVLRCSISMPTRWRSLMRCKSSVFARSVDSVQLPAAQ
jgi:hypothetical protein